MKSWDKIALHDLPALAKEISSLLQPGKPILVNAEMGSGKTTFATSLVEQLGGNKLEVSSPTFSIIQSYPLKNGGKFHHVDLYRIEEDEEFLDLDLDSYINAKDYLYIEWPELFENYFDIPCNYLSINKKGDFRSFHLK